MLVLVHDDAMAVRGRTHKRFWTNQIFACACATAAYLHTHMLVQVWRIYGYSTIQYEYKVLCTRYIVPSTYVLVHMQCMHDERVPRTCTYVRGT